VPKIGVISSVKSTLGERIFNRKWSGKRGFARQKARRELRELKVRSRQKKVA